MIKEGFYEDAIFRFIIDFSEKFPKELPTITFKNSIVHPLISSQGVLDLPVVSLVVVSKLDLRGRQTID